MAAKKPAPLIPDKEQGLVNRTQDTGWGRATAHLIPFYSLVYAITRRTITPALYVLGGSFIVGIALGLSTPEIPEEKRDSISLALALVITPPLAKAGIDQARKFAEEKLQ